MPFTERFSDPDDKRAYTKKIFERLAPHYNFSMQCLTLGCDKYWKRQLLASLPEKNKPVCLDLACGTGDVAFGLAQTYHGATIIGVDNTSAMVRRAAGRNPYDGVSFIVQDMCTLDMYDKSVDILTGGFALHNAPDLRKAVFEIGRVLKPNGVACFIEFSKPVDGLWQSILGELLFVWSSFWSLLLHRRLKMFAGVAEMFKDFPDRAQMQSLLDDAGFRVLERRRLFPGMVEILVIQKIQSQKSVYAKATT